MAWYVIVLIVTTAVFLITTLVSVLSGGFDLDADVNFSSDFGLSDFFSFKGLMHFIIGFSLTLTLMKGFTLLSAAAGVFTGTVFVIVLYYLYHLILGMNQSMRYESKIDNMDAEVYFWDDASQTGEVFITLEGRPVTVTLSSTGNDHFEKGQRIKVTGTRHSVEPIKEH